MKSLPILIDAICDAYDCPSFVPSNGVTHCNEAANAIAKAMGCNDLANKTADQIFEYMTANPSTWQTLTMDRCQFLANQGSLVFAVANSTMLKQEHGHIAVIRPGMVKNSGKWGDVPSVMNVGRQNFIARSKMGPLTNQPVGVNESFITLPKFFVWVNSL